MILAALNDYYQRLRDDPQSGVAEPGFSLEKIGFAIVLNRAGEVVDVQDLRVSSGKRVLPASLSVPQPEKRTAGIRSNLFWDKTSYVLGVSATSKRSAQEHKAFISLHRELLADAEDPGLRALLAFLDAWNPERFEDNPHFSRHGEDFLDANLVFRLEEERAYLHERVAARAAWAKHQQQDESSTTGMCLVTGNITPLARLHPSIKGVNGAQSSGASIVSFNQPSFTSYGKEQGSNAPVGDGVTFAYTTALNHLLRRDPKNRQRLQVGDTTVVFWAQAGDRVAANEGEELLAAFFDPSDEDLQAARRLHDALQLVRQGRPLRELDGKLDDATRIFVLGLAPNASRLSIRFWETDTLGRFARRLAEHFDDLQLKPARRRRPPSPWALALATAPIRGGKAKSEDVSPLLAGELMRAVLAGTRYPQSILSNLVMRFRADGEVTDLRVMLCKGVLARAARLDEKQGKSIRQGGAPVSLDIHCDAPGYLLGRLFSSLENVQRAALGRQISSTIRDRYYGAASATPASIFPVLLRNTQNHLGKLRREKPGLAVVLEREIGEIVDALPPSFPRSLPIEEQGRFAIGYYHQRQARFASEDEADSTDPESEGESA